MYVCVCNALKEAQFQEIAIEHPEMAALEAYGQLGAEPDCGTCMFFAQEVMDKARENHKDPTDYKVV